jgi:hypothetical protein
MRISINSASKALIIASALAFAGASVATAATASQREYKRGYRDCLAGRYDQNQHGASYKKGCRAAEDKMMKKKKPAAQECPVDVSEADRANYPGCN